MLTDMVKQASYEPLYYPFCAIVGQEQMKKALLLNAVCPGIGGVLIRGQKGTCKSTAVRALPSLLPEIDVVAGCPFQCDPSGKLCFVCQEKVSQGIKLGTVRRKAHLVNLPLGSTEDRIIGSIHLEKAIKEGVKAMEPGLLARAHRGILYIDEVNLLHDHLVDIILDASATGINVVEREGISCIHPSRFILIGTMNPEEGELRPQLLDRFGLCVEVKAPENLEERIKVIKLREAFDKDPVHFHKSYREKEKNLRRKIKYARNLLPKVTIKEELLELCSRLSLEAMVAGHRADITIRKTARAIAALDLRDKVTRKDVLEAAELALYHRKRNRPPSSPQRPENTSSEKESQDQEQNKNSPKNQPDKPGQGKHRQQPSNTGNEPAKKGKTPHEESGTQSEKVFSIGSPFKPKPFPIRKDRIPRKGSGRRIRSRTSAKAGRYVRSHVARDIQDLALDATLRAAAPYQRARSKPGVAVSIEDQDFREKVREKKIGSLLVFIVDASGSMGAGKRMVETKGAIVSLLLDAYQKRDKIAMVAFKGSRADILLPPTASVELAYRLLEELPTGGKTPLSHGLSLGYSLMESQLRKDPHVYPLMVLISDGKANVSLRGDNPFQEVRQISEHIRDDTRIRKIVIDVEKPGLLMLGMAKKISQYLDAHYFKIEDLKASEILNVVRQISDNHFLDRPTGNR